MSYPPTPPPSVNRLFEDYIYHSLLYYGLDSPIISDQEFDQLCTKLGALASNVSHPDRALLDTEALKAGTGYQLMGHWPDWALERARVAGVEHWMLDQTAGSS